VFGLPFVLLLGAVAFYFARGGPLWGADERYVVQPGRDLSPCYDPAECLEPSAELAALFADDDACARANTVIARVCLAPLGDVHRS
jgi:hypothetical protein